MSNNFVAMYTYACYGTVLESDIEQLPWQPGHINFVIITEGGTGMCNQYRHMWSKDLKYGISHFHIIAILQFNPSAFIHNQIEV